MDGVVNKFAMQPKYITEESTTHEMNKAVINFLVLAFFFLENDVPKMKPNFFF